MSPTKCFWHPRSTAPRHADSLISAIVPPIDGVNEECWERLWAKKVGQNQYRVCSIPFYLYDLHLDDEVETNTDGLVTRVTRSANHYTFRALFKATGRPSARRDLRSEINRIGLRVEWRSENLVAIDAATAESAQEIADFLLDAEEAGDLEYETGRTT